MGELEEEVIFDLLNEDRIFSHARHWMEYIERKVQQIQNVLE
jgi:hypothetical protein